MFNFSSTGVLEICPQNILNPCAVPSRSTMRGRLLYRRLLYRTLKNKVCDIAYWDRARVKSGWRISNTLVSDLAIKNLRSDFRASCYFGVESVTGTRQFAILARTGYSGLRQMLKSLDRAEWLLRKVENVKLAIISKPSASFVWTKVSLTLLKIC